MVKNPIATKDDTEPKKQTTEKQKTPHISKSSRAGLVLPVGRIKRYIKRVTPIKTLTYVTDVAMTAAIEYTIMELINCATSQAASVKKKMITPRQLFCAIQEDADFAHLFGDIIVQHSGALPIIRKEFVKTKKVL